MDRYIQENDYFLALGLSTCCKEKLCAAIIEVAVSQVESVLFD
jgi:hypothetical protein